MIKVMNLVSLIMAPIVVQFTDFSLGIIVTIVVGILAILWAVRRSDRQVDLTGETEGALSMAAAGGGSVSPAEVSNPARKPAPRRASGRTPGRKPAARKK
jgi:MFS superfamily sulfate permease-like transporter